MCSQRSIEFIWSMFSAKSIHFKTVKKSSQIDQQKETLQRMYSKNKNKLESSKMLGQFRGAISTACNFCSIQGRKRMRDKNTHTHTANDMRWFGLNVCRWESHKMTLKTTLKLYSTIQRYREVFLVGLIVGVWAFQNGSEIKEFWFDGVYSSAHDDCNCMNRSLPLSVQVYTFE